MSIGAASGQDDFDHYSEEQMADPYAMYERFRQCPVGRSSRYGGFAYAATFDGAKKVFSDFQTFSSHKGPGLPGRPVKVYPLDLDPPEHAKFRRLVNRHFSQEVAEANRARTEGLVNGFIDNIIEQGHCDLADDVVRPVLPPTVLPLIGVPIEDQERFEVWIDYLTRRRVSDPEGVVRAADEAVEHLQKIVAYRRTSEPQDDALGSLMNGKVDGRDLSDDEIARTLLIILAGGLDTTSISVLESCMYFFQNPAEAERMRSGELDWAVAIEELLRFFSPVTALGRVAMKDTEIAGCPIKAGEFIMAMNGAANRDPEKFVDADKCVLDRKDNPHISFGNGAHICLGRHIARMEIDVMLKAILTRLPDCKIADDFVPEYWVGQGRALKTLPVTFTPGQRLGAAAE